ncbi:MAG: PCRF domain-containing protein, partial [Bifidobacterium sp.]
MAEFDVNQTIEQARSTYESIAKAIDPELLRHKIQDLEQQASAPGLWDDQDHAQQVTSALSVAQTQLRHIQSAKQRLEDVETLLQMAQEEEDRETLDEAQHDAEQLQKDLSDMAIQTLLDGEYDARAAVVTIRSGAGGVDAAD